MIIFTSLQGQHYALLSDMPAPMIMLDDHQKTEYAEIMQQQSNPTLDEDVHPDESSKEHDSGQLGITTR